MDILLSKYGEKDFGFYLVDVQEKDMEQFSNKGRVYLDADREIHVNRFWGYR